MSVARGTSRRSRPLSAGSTIPVTFDLGGDKGMDLFLPGSPEVLPDGVPAVGRLVFDPWSRQYGFIWKTDRARSGMTKTFSFTLVDGTTHTVEVTFR